MQKAGERLRANLVARNPDAIHFVGASNRYNPDEEDSIYQIVDLLVDTCSTKRKMLRFAGDDKPAEVVRSRLKKLNANHIRFVLDSLAENTTPVRGT